MRFFSIIRWFSYGVLAVVLFGPAAFGAEKYQTVGGRIACITREAYDDILVAHGLRNQKLVNELLDQDTCFVLKGGIPFVMLKRGWDGVFQGKLSVRTASGEQSVVVYLGNKDIRRAP